jgi:DNA-binding GntR family transcriptional regulator
MPLSPDKSPASAFSAGSASLDRSSPEPVYSQLARLLRQRIAGGELRAGERVPSVPELSAAFGVASMTVRQAIEQLAQEGAVVRERGRGTFVRSPDLASATFSLDDLRRQLTDADLQVRILGARSVRATPRVAGKLSVKAGVRVISIKRLLVRAEAPIFYHSEYLIWDPRRPLVEAELGVTSLQGLFSGVGQSGIKNGELALHASAMTKGEADYLSEEAGTLAWVVEHLFYDFDSRPVSWGRFICRAEQLTFHAAIGISEDGRSGNQGRG